jgi:hypothetical protein
VYTRPYNEKDLPDDAASFERFVANFEKLPVVDLLTEFYNSHPDLPTSI